MNIALMRSKERKTIFHIFELLFIPTWNQTLFATLYTNMFKIINKDTNVSMNVVPAWLWLRLGWLRTENEISFYNYLIPYNLGSFLFFS